MINLNVYVTREHNAREIHNVLTDVTAFHAYQFMNDIASTFKEQGNEFEWVDKGLRTDLFVYTQDSTRTYRVEAK